MTGLPPVTEKPGKKFPRSRTYQGNFNRLKSGNLEWNVSQGSCKLEVQLCFFLLNVYTFTGRRLVNWFAKGEVSRFNFKTLHQFGRSDVPDEYQSFKCMFWVEFHCLKSRSLMGSPEQSSMTTLVRHDSSSFKVLETCQRMTTITPTFQRQILLSGTNADNNV